MYCATMGLGSQALFLCKSAYQKREEGSHQLNPQISAVWRNVCPPKVEIFTWQALRNGIPTKLASVRRGIIVYNEDGNDLRIFCSESTETTNHLLLHCNFTWKI